MKTLLSKGNQAERYYILDVFKALMIVFVIITHIQWTDTQRLMFAFPYWVEMAMPVFMIITGFVNPLAVERKGIAKIKDWFAPKAFLSRLTTVLVPYLTVYLFLATVFIVKGDIALSQAMLTFFTGGWGPGSYYVPVLIQFHVFFPFMFALVKRWKWKGYTVLIAFNVLIDASFTYFEWSVLLYRLSFFRYIVFVCAGMYLYSVKGKDNKIALACLFLGGAIYITAVNYLGYSPVIFTNWITTSFPTVLYIFPIVATVFIYLNKPISGKWGVFSTIGESTYHIFLVQMVWYSSFGNMFAPWIMLVPNIIICVAVGCLFSKLDNRLIQKPIKEAIRKRG